MLKQISISVNEINVFQNLAKSHHCRIIIVDCKQSSSREMSLLLEVSGSNSVDHLVSELKTLPDIKRVYIADCSPTRTLVMLILNAPLFCDVSRNSNAFCVACPYNSDLTDGTVNWNLFVKEPDDISRVMNMLEFRGAKAEIRKIGDAYREEVLTARQKEVFSSAVRRGYFDFPRRTSLTELANELSIKPSTLSEILRKAESKIAKSYATMSGIPV